MVNLATTIPVSFAIQITQRYSEPPCTLANLVYHETANKQTKTKTPKVVCVHACMRASAYVRVWVHVCVRACACGCVTVTAIGSGGGDGGSGAEDEHNSGDNNDDSVQLIQVLRHNSPKSPMC